MFILCAAVSGQKVTISNEINVRNDIQYEIVGELGDRVVLYRESNNKKSFSFFDEKMGFIYERELQLEDSNAELMANIAMDSTIHVIYNYSLDSNLTLLRRYDHTGLCLDTTLLYMSANNFDFKEYKIKTSEDKKSTVILNFDLKEGMVFHLLDHTKRNMSAIYTIPIVEKKNLNKFIGLELSNSGLVYVLFEKNNSRFSKNKHEFYLLSFDMNSGKYAEELIPCNDIVSVDVKTLYDNKNDIFNILGLYSFRDKNSAEGVFHFRKSGIVLDSINYIVINKFEDNFYRDLYKDKIINKLENHLIKEVQLTNDGGVIMLTEFNKIFSRRSPFQGYGTGVGVNANAWTDHYIEEIVIISLSPKLDIRWQNILLKKQFSQDDGGIYSSFFLFELPSRFKLIFNDDIKNNNMVSEFELFPSGKLIRKSLLSTEYQKLKIRFDGAVQVSKNTFLVPSEKSGKLKLVKVRY